MSQPLPAMPPNNMLRQSLPPRPVLANPVEKRPFASLPLRQPQTMERKPNTVLNLNNNNTQLPQLQQQTPKRTPIQLPPKLQPVQEPVIQQVPRIRNRIEPQYQYKTISSIYANKNQMWKWVVLILSIAAIALLITNLTMASTIFSGIAIGIVLIILIILIWKLLFSPKTTVEEVLTTV
jgi:hypothetical protein